MIAVQDWTENGKGFPAKYALLLLFPLVVAGCGLSGRPTATTMDGYVATVKSARTAVPIAVQMEELFPVADHFITHFGFSNGPRIWNTVVYFGGRFELTMQVDVEIDYSTSRVVRAIGTPVFYLNAVESLKITSDGSADGTFRGQDHRTFGPIEWETIRKRNGDLTVIGIQEGSLPVPQFDAFVATSRRPRVRVSLLE
jgi:hypothetical protein